MEPGSQLAVVNARGAIVELHSPESEAEARLSELRRGVRADIAKALTTFTGQSPSRRRAANSEDLRAISLSSPRTMLPQMSEELSLVLPPLQPLKQYHPTVDSTLAIVSPRGTQLKAPRPSQLGSAEGAWAEEPIQEFLLPSEDMAAAVAKRRLFLARKREEEISEQEISSPRPQRVVRSKTICKSRGDVKVRGVDPMAGGLFSRNANLDVLSHKRGIYEASLREKNQAARPHLQRPQ
jgi:hypothetical protein